MKIRVESVYISVSAVLVVGLVLFTYGFFPLSYSSTEKATRFDLPKNIGELDLDHGQYTGHFHRTVVMIIDALRWDFVAGDKMSYLSNLIKRNESCLIQLRVDAPTVTMPRIKAMTSGTVPNFIDMVLNFGTHMTIGVDNFVTQMRNQGKIVFYGDNTWTKLFPDVFTRYGENVDSLYVNDFYEGDKNVTERMSAELVHPDWKLMILHYLGLDHIGHVEGPYSEKVPGKLEEMDRQVTKIVTAIAKWKIRYDRPSLFLLTGDHGMRDSGGHGGSSPGETLVPLVVTGAQCESSTVTYNQIDLATTFSVLNGLPIPHSSIGIIIPELIGDLSPKQQLFALHYNGERLLVQIRRHFRLDAFGELEFFKQHRRAVELHGALLVGNVTSDGHIFRQCRMLYQASAQEMSGMLSATFLKYDEASIFAGIVLVAAGTVIMLLGLHRKSLDALQISSFVPRDFILSLIIGMLLKHVVFKLFPIDSDLFQFNIPMNLLFLSIVTIFFYLYKLFLALIATIELDFSSWRRLDWVGKFLVLISVGHLMSLGASSFIEEEHQIWYYACNSLFLLLVAKQLQLDMWLDNEFVLLKTPSDIDEQQHQQKKKKGDRNYGQSILEKIEKCHNLILSSILLILVHVVVRRLNQTGDKWSHLRDFGDFLAEKDNKAYLTSWVILGTILTCYSLHRLGGLLTNILTFTALLLVFFYRSSAGQILIFNQVFSATRLPVLLFWLNVVEVILIEFLPFLYRLLIHRSVTRVGLGRFMGSFVTIFALISTLLHKPHNVMLVPACVLTCRWVKDRILYVWPGVKERTVLIIVTHFWCGKLFFFYQGNSNSLATIDLNAGYIGLDTYHPILVGLLLTLNTFSGPILSFLMALCHLYEQLCGINLTTDQCKTIRTTITVNVLRVQSVLVSLPLIVYMIVATLFRHHLFVWTVFSPKLIYELYAFALYVVCWISFYGWTKMTNQFANITS